VGGSDRRVDLTIRNAVEQARTLTVRFDAATAPSVIVRVNGHRGRMYRRSDLYKGVALDVASKRRTR